MRLLFDRNLSPALPAVLADLYPQSLHIWDLAMDTAAAAIRAYARPRGLVIVAKDTEMPCVSKIGSAKAAVPNPTLTLWTASR